MPRVPWRTPTLRWHAFLPSFGSFYIMEKVWCELQCVGGKGGKTHETEVCLWPSSGWREERVKVTCPQSNEKWKVLRPWLTHCKLLIGMAAIWSPLTVPDTRGVPYCELSWASRQPEERSHSNPILWMKIQGSEILSDLLKDTQLIKNRLKPGGWGVFPTS